MCVYGRKHLLLGAHESRRERGDPFEEEEEERDTHFHCPVYAGPTGGERGGGERGNLNRDTVPLSVLRAGHQILAAQDGGGQLSFCPNYSF